MYQTNLTPEQKAKWLVALRSGDFKQARQMLKIDNRFCCLGVMSCVVSETDDPYYLWYEGKITDGYKLAKELLTEPVAHRLMVMNDGAQGEVRRTFPEIADWVEENLISIHSKEKE